MNLLFQRCPSPITSKLRSNDVKKHYSTSPLVLKIKRQTNHEEIPMANEDNNQRLKRTTPNSSTRRPSSPAFNGKQQQQQQQAGKRSVIIDNNNNNLTPNIDENSSTKRFKQDDFNLKKVDACVETVSIGLATEPDQLGPCEPGTSVVLEGIVWNETDSGILVVNVTWRGKTYVGTLLDSTKQDWACPRLTCESPTSDYDPRSSSKTSRAKRANPNGHNRSSFQQLSSNNLSSICDDRKLRSSSNKSRQSKRTNLSTIDEIPSPLTSPFPTNSTTFFPSSNHESQLIPCPESQCHKQFVSILALNYHRSDAHKKTDSIATTTTLSTSAIQQANTRDEEDVAHILANVADYVRRPSPPRSSPDHQRSTTLTWPCPQISSNLVLSSSLNNNEQTSTRTEREEIKSTVKPADHVLLHIQDEPPASSSTWINPTIPHPPASSSPAYSDISDEDPTTTNENEQISPLPPSTVNLLNDPTVISNPPWSAQMLLQQYGSYMQQMNKDLTSHCLNSKSNPNGTSDSTVKNILDSRGLSIAKPPSPPTNDSLYHYSPTGKANDSKLSPSLVNSLTSPNENLLKPSTTTSR